MAQYSIVEEPRPRRPRSNHPSHPHNLRRTKDIRDSYPNGLWRCDLCGLEFDSKTSLPGKPGHSEDDKEIADPSYAFHCEECSYDVCSVCFKGRLHPFHHHRLKKARVSLVYPETGGQWRCDACQKVFTELTAPTSNHCSQCEVDICDKCFTGSWKSIHHGAHHTLKPVDPRLLYRKYMSWICDSCEREFTSSNSETFFNCSVCQYDICSDCFMGEKHHLHQHPLCLVSKATHGGDICSNCNKFIVESDYRKCRDADCCFSLCGLCYLSPPKYHPFHREHPLALCDADSVYPQSGGLWHCDNCTKSNPYGEQSPLPASQPMYHCDVCDFDLCESCYKRGLRQNLQQSASSSEVYETAYDTKRSMSSGYYLGSNRDNHVGTHLLLPSYLSTAGSYTHSSTGKRSNHFIPESTSNFEHSGQNHHSSGMHNIKPTSPVRPESLTSLSSSASYSYNYPPLTSSRMNSHYSMGESSESTLNGSMRYNSLYGATTLTGSSSNGSHSALCVLCRTYTATKYFCHGTGVMTCTAKPLVCDRCANDVLMRQKPCPSCGRTPQRISDTSF